MSCEIALLLLTISTTHRPATDLGYLLAKNPSRCQTFELAFGKAHVFYPQASDEVCTAALLLDLNPLMLSRRWRGPVGENGLGQYVNDRPYAASSFMSVAISNVFGTALNGNSRERPELAKMPIPLTATLPVMPSYGGETLVRTLFEPLGYTVTAQPLPLDPAFPEWGLSRYHSVTLSATGRLRDLLTHLYVLLPVLDDDKHYWTGPDEIDKLLDKGEGWLATHPARDTIVRGYLRRRRKLVAAAFSRLVAADDLDPEETEDTGERQEYALEEPISLNDQRIAFVVGALKRSNAHEVVDVGCGDGKLLQALLADRAFTRLAGVDVSHRALELASRRLNLDRLPPAQRQRIDLFQGSLVYRDRRLAGFDAVCAVEVIEHIDPQRLQAFERVLFEFAQPNIIVLTTPNADFNVRFPSLPAGSLRHRDHRFEWTKEEFSNWANNLAQRHGYAVAFEGIGPVDDEVGTPTQMAVFTR